MKETPNSFLDDYVKKLVVEVVASTRSNDAHESARKTAAAFSGARAPTSPGASPPADEDALYERFRARLLSDEAVLLQISVLRPALEVSVKRRVIEADDESLQGKIGILIHEGWFASYRTASAVFDELKRRGVSVGKTTVYDEMGNLTSMGFFRKDSNGYKLVKGAEVNVR